MRLLARAAVVVALAAATVALGGPRLPAPAGDAGPAWLDPGRFTSRIDNPFWPMVPGSRWVYRETDGSGGERRVEVTVIDRTATVLGIEARVVRDAVFERGRLREVSDDWFAQDLQGNLWQLGEVAHERAGGRPSGAAGSWRAGVAGAQPVLVLPAHPDPGVGYRHRGTVTRVLSVGTTAKVPYGSFDRVLVTEERGSVGSGRVEREFYARGVGPVLAVTVSGGSGREELVGFAGAPPELQRRDDDGLRRLAVTRAPGPARPPRQWPRPNSVPYSSAALTATTRVPLGGPSVRTAWSPWM
jgi:hypothetical protein